MSLLFITVNEKKLQMIENKRTSLLFPFSFFFYFHHPYMMSMLFNGMALDSFITMFFSVEFFPFMRLNKMESSSCHRQHQFNDIFAHTYTRSYVKINMNPRYHFVMNRPSVRFFFLKKNLHLS